MPILDGSSEGDLKASIPKRPNEERGASTSVACASAGLNHRLRDSVLWIFLSIGVVVVLRFSEPVIVPTVYAFLGTVLLSPIADAVERMNFPRWSATAVCIVLVMVFAGLSFVMATIALDSVLEQLPTYLEKGRLLAVSLGAEIRRTTALDPASTAAGARVGLSKVLNEVPAQIFGIFDIAVSFLLVLLIFAFFLHFRDALSYRLTNILRQWRFGSRNKAIDLRRIVSIVRQYLWAKSLISLATGLSIAIIMWAIGLDFWPLWGVLAVVFNFIPNIGPLTATLPAIVVGFLQGGPALGLMVIAVATPIHIVSGNIVEPMIIGTSLRLNFVAVLLSLIIWALIWGSSGLILAVPITASIKIILDQTAPDSTLAVLLSSSLTEIPDLDVHEGEIAATEVVLTP